MNFDLKHHLKYYDGMWIFTLCMLSLPPVIIAMLDSKIEGLALFMISVLFIVFPLFIAMQINKAKVKRAFKHEDEEGVATFKVTGKLLSSTVQDNSGNTYKLRGAYGVLKNSEYKCKFKHNKKLAWITHIDK